MEPITAAIGAGNVARSLLGGLVDRWARARNANVDAAALVRLLLLEARRNREVLKVAVGGKEPLPHSALWDVPLILETEVIETLLGQGPVASQALAAVQDLEVSDRADGPDGVDFLTNIYVRLAALQGLAALNRRSGLTKVRIERRLKNLHSDFDQLVRVLAQPNRGRS